MNDNINDSSSRSKSPKTAGETRTSQPTVRLAKVIDEAARLRALYELAILDTPADPSFDRLTSLARMIFGTSIAFVSFVDESRQWFKSRVGPITVTESPRSFAFCAHTIRGDGVMTVLDAHQDARFRNNPSIFGAGDVRFYAGAPIVTASGYNVGAICIADSEPRAAFAAEQQIVLKTLAELASQATEAHWRNQELTLNEAEARERYSLVARATQDGVWDWKIAEGCVYYSPRWQYLLGLPEENVYATPAHWLERVHPDDLVAVNATIGEHLRGDTPRFKSEHRVRHGDGSWRWILVRGLAEKSNDGLVTRMAGSISDITKDKTCDLLTGLPNRLFLLERLSQLIARGVSTGDWHFALLFVDVDRFKYINDRLGHAGGDKVLLTVSERLIQTVGRTRTSNGSIVARFAGDEFVILLDDVSNSSQAYGIGQRIHKAVAEPMEYGGERLNIRLSIGIAMAKPELKTAESFLHNSDLALCRAKASAKGTSVVFDPSMQIEDSSRLELEDGLREAISLNELEVRYQPQVNLKTGELIGCEALVRWQHPKRGLLFPGDFISIAEKIGLVSAIDSWVMKAACKQLAQWRHLPHGQELTMSVNISSHSLSQRNLKYQLLDVLADCKLSHRSLCLELTESVLTDDPPATIRLMRELHDLGIGLHMDDFGSGYSSFKYLYDLPFDVLKIDRSFLIRFPSDPKAKSIIESILALAQTLGLRVVAEGVEEAVQASALAGMGCEYGQGYFFDRALSADDLRVKYLEDDAITSEALRMRNALDKSKASS